MAEREPQDVDPAAQNVRPGFIWPESLIGLGDLLPPPDTAEGRARLIDERYPVSQPAAPPSYRTQQDGLLASDGETMSDGRVVSHGRLVRRRSLGPRHVPGPESGTRDRWVAESARLAMTHRYVVDLLREAWSTRPDLVEGAIAAPGFEGVVRALDRYAWEGIDVGAVVASLPLAELDLLPTHGGRVWRIAQLTGRVTQRLLDYAEYTRRGARDDTEHAAAELLRRAWRSYPHLAEQVVTGPAFRLLANRMVDAHEAGHDVEAVLPTLDPAVFDASQLSNPSGAVTFAFTRAIDDPQVDNELPRTGLIPTADHAARSPGVGQTAVTGSPPGTQPGPARGVVAAVGFEPVTPNTGNDQRSTIARGHGTRRPHGSLTDADLRRRIEQGRSRASELARDRETAATRWAQLRDVAATGHGRHMRVVDDHLTGLRLHVNAIHETDQLEAQRHAAIGRARDAAEQRAHAEHDLAQLGRGDPSRHTELSERIDQLRDTQNQALHAATELARRADHLHLHSGPPEKRHDILIQANRAEATYPDARDAALERDHHVAQLAAHRFHHLVRQEHLYSQELEALRAELHFRQELPDAERHVEGHQRALDPITPADHLGPVVAPESPEVAGFDLAQGDLELMESSADLDIDYSLTVEPPIPNDPEL